MGTDTENAAAIVAVTQTLNSYMLAIDKADTSSLRNRVFHPEAKIALLQDVGVNEYCNFVADIMTKIRTQHFLFNSVVEIDGDKASARSYFVGYHRVPAGDQGEACAALFGRQTGPIDSVIGGIYTDEVVQIAIGWRIIRRNITLLWQQQTPTGQLMKPDWI